MGYGLRGGGGERKNGWGVSFGRPRQVDDRSPGRGTDLFMTTRGFPGGVFLPSDHGLDLRDQLITIVQGSPVIRLMMSPFSRMYHTQEAIGSIIRPEKRVRDSGGGVRPSKRVTFSSEDCILGRAQDYDRRSFEEPTPQTRAYAPPHPSPFTGSDGQEAATSLTEGGHVNFCGMWRRSHSFNWSALLELSGVPKDASQRQLENMKTSAVVHFIEHDAVSFRLVVNDDSGRTTQDQHMYIGGQPRPSPYSSSGPSNRTTSTLANMRWTKNGQALILTTVDAATGDEMTVSRRLGMGGAVMVQHYRARCARTGDSAEAVTVFRRI